MQRSEVALREKGGEVPMATETFLAEIRVMGVLLRIRQWLEFVAYDTMLSFF